MQRVVTPAPPEWHDAIDAVFTRTAEAQRTLVARIMRLVCLGLVLVLLMVTAGVALGVAVVAS